MAFQSAGTSFFFHFRRHILFFLEFLFKWEISFVKPGFLSFTQQRTNLSQNNQKKTIITFQKILHSPCAHRSVRLVSVCLQCCPFLLHQSHFQQEPAILPRCHIQQHSELASILLPCAFHHQLHVPGASRRTPNDLNVHHRKKTRETQIRRKRNGFVAIFR